jgi:hypothetical protein
MDDPKLLDSNQNLSEKLLGSDSIEHAHPPFALQENNNNNNNNNSYNYNNDGDPFDPLNNGGGGGEIVVDALHAAHGLRGETQAPQYRDVPFLIVFVLHLLVVFYLAFFQGLGSLSQDLTYPTNNSTNTNNSNSTNNNSTGDDKPAYQSDDAPSSVSLWGLVWLTLLTSVISLGIASASLQFLTRHAEQMIQISLIGSCLMFGFLFITLLGNGAEELGFMVLLILVFTALYAYSVWHTIPFAAANLNTALAAVQTNKGVCGLAYAVAGLTALWIGVWALAMTGASYHHATCQDGVCQSRLNFLVAFFLILSFFWTAQVLKVRTAYIYLVCGGNPFLDTSTNSHLVLLLLSSPFHDYYHSTDSIDSTIEHASRDHRRCRWNLVV